MSSNAPQQPFNKVAEVFQLLSRVKDPNTHPNDRAHAWETINMYLFSGTPPAVWQNFPLITRGDSLYTKADFVQEVLDYDAEKNALTPVEDEDYSGWETYRFDGKAVEESEFKPGVEKHNSNLGFWDDRKRFVYFLLDQILERWLEQKKAMNIIYAEWMNMRGNSEV